MNCTHCDEPVSAKGLCRLHYMRAYKAQNRDKLRAQERARVAAIPGYESARYARNRDKQLASAKDYYQRNREARIAYARDWYFSNLDAARAISAARAARRRNVERMATPPWADHIAILAVYKEAARLTTQTGIPHDVDHVIPLQAKSVCGLHVHWNLRPLPASVNRSKQNRYEERP